MASIGYVSSLGRCRWPDFARSQASRTCPKFHAGDASQQRRPRRRQHARWSATRGTEESTVSEALGAEDAPATTGKLDGEEDGDELSTRGILTDSVLETVWKKDSDRGSCVVCDGTEHPWTPYSTGSIIERIYYHVNARRNMNDFLELFQGEFDNYDQVVDDMSKELYPREGGGHEHIHCQLTVLNNPRLGDGVVFAKYYFDGDPNLVFRSRLYKVWVEEGNPSGTLEMKIFRLYEETERRLRECNYDARCIDWQEEDLFTYLGNCEVFWNRPDEHNRTKVFDGYMRDGGCSVFSPQLKQHLEIKDELLLNETHLSVNDRGFDEQGRFVYGNQRGVPYVMRRLTDKSDTLWWTVTGEESERLAKALNTRSARYTPQKSSA